MARALGDLPLKTRNLVTCEPDVLSFRLATSSPSSSPRPEFALLATDGLWDVATNEEAAELARRVLARLEEKAGAAAEATMATVTAGERLAMAARWRRMCVCTCMPNQYRWREFSRGLSL